MVNYYLDFNFTATESMKQTETFRVFETKTSFIHFRSATSMTIQIFSGMNKYQYFDYQKYGTDYDNISLFTKELEDTIPPNTNYTKHFANITPYIFIRILNTAGVAGNFRLMIDNSTEKDFVSASVRDSNLKLNQLVSLTRPTTDINLDILDNNITGFKNVVIKAKGQLSNTEALLMNSDTITGWLNNAQDLSNVYINSDSVNDIQTTGIGARTILVKGLDTSRKETEITAITNGTNLSLVGAMLFVNSIEVDTTGSLGFNSGHIRAYNTSVSASNLITSIELGEGQSFNPQYEVPSVNTLYITSMSVFGRCQDEGYIKIVKYTYKDVGVSNMVYKVLDKFSVSPNMNFNRKCDFVIQDGERISILRKSTIAPQGLNDITIQLYGTQKLTNLDIQSNI